MAHDVQLINKGISSEDIENLMGKPQKSILKKSEFINPFRENYTINTCEYNGKGAYVPKEVK